MLKFDRDLYVSALLCRGIDTGADGRGVLTGVGVPCFEVPAGAVAYSSTFGLVLTFAFMAPPSGQYPLRVIVRSEAGGQLAAIDLGALELAGESRFEFFVREIELAVALGCQFICVEVRGKVECVIPLIGEAEVLPSPSNGAP